MTIQSHLWIDIFSWFELVDWQFVWWHWWVSITSFKPNFERKTSGHFQFPLATLTRLPASHSLHLINFSSQMIWNSWTASDEMQRDRELNLWVPGSSLMPQISHQPDTEHQDLIRLIHHNFAAFQQEPHVQEFYQLLNSSLKNLWERFNLLLWCSN